MNETPLSSGQVVARFALIGALMLGAVVLFAFAGGWLSPHRLTQARMVDAMHAGAGGPHPGFRSAHAKGMCFNGTFESSGAAAEISKAAVFASGRVPLVGRFALASGMPFLPDALAVPRSMALRFMPADAPEWRTGMNNIPLFIVKTPEAFYEQLKASEPDPTTGKPDPAAMKDFVGRHPETAHAFEVIKAQPPQSGFADSTFNSLNAFRFVNAAGVSVPVRWGVVPMQPAVVQANSPDDDTPHTKGENHLFDDLIVHAHEQPLRWRLVVTVGEPGDSTSDSTELWPASRRHIDAGVVTVEKLSSEDDGPCTDINFDPMVLPPGIEASDDPLLSARSAVYAKSFTLRTAARKEKPPSAVSPSEVEKVVKP
jgi:catalase